MLARASRSRIGQIEVVDPRGRARFNGKRKITCHKDSYVLSDLSEETGGPDEIGDALVHLLRDQTAGTHPAAEALIRLRAMQAALFLAGILLRWDTQTLGPDPAARLRGDLTPQVSASLMTMARTDHAALTALALHLNQGPAYFTCWSLTDLAEDGSVLYEPAHHQHNPPKWMSYPNYQAEMARRVGVTEIPCAGPIVIPEHARPIFAAHRVYRMTR